MPHQLQNLKQRPQYKRLAFDSPAELAEWMLETTFAVITLKDNWQDVTTLHVAATGEIIQSNAQQRLWHGRFVSMDAVSPGKPLFIQGFPDDKFLWNESDFICDRVTYISKRKK